MISHFINPKKILEEPRSDLSMTTEVKKGQALLKSSFKVLPHK